MLARVLRPQLRPWLAAVLGFYATWTYFVLSRGLVGVVVAHWPIAAAMAAGSYAAGSTPMGGGTVGFPILVLLLGQAPEIGRDFSFAVQSVGMTSASLFILCRRQTIAWSLLRPTLLGSLVGTPLGILLVAPHVPGFAVKLLFAAAWGAFGLVHLRRTPEFAALAGRGLVAARGDRALGLAIGMGAGASIVALAGVGVDLVLYAVLVLWSRCDLRIAVPTSVLAMSFNSLLGVLVKNLAGGLRESTFEHWLAAAPVVVIGAPIGAWVVDRIGRAATLYIVSSLCVGQFLWTLADEWRALGPLSVFVTLLLLVLFILGFEQLRRRGLRRSAS